MRRSRFVAKPNVVRRPPTTPNVPIPQTQLNTSEVHVEICEEVQPNSPQKLVINERPQALQPIQNEIVPIAESCVLSPVSKGYQTPTNALLSPRTPQSPQRPPSTPGARSITSEKSVPKRRVFTGYEELDRSMFTMADLISWNPKNGTKLQKVPVSVKRSASPINVKLERTVKSEWQHGETIKREMKSEYLKTEGSDVKFNAPQVMIDEAGNIVLNQASLTIQQDSESAAAQLDLVEEQNFVGSQHISSFSFRRKGRGTKTGTKNWSIEETDKFYHILAATGPDFSLMNQFFENRTRSELKSKYNRESRANPDKLREIERNPKIFNESLYDFVIDEAVQSNERKMREKQLKRDRERQKREERLRKADPERYERRQQKKLIRQQLLEQGSLPTTLTKNVNASMGE